MVVWTLANNLQGFLIVLQVTSNRRAVRPVQVQHSVFNWHSVSWPFALVVDLGKKAAPCLRLESWPSLFLKDLLGLSQWLTQRSNRDCDSKWILKRERGGREFLKRPFPTSVQDFGGFIQHHLVPVGTDLLKVILAASSHSLLESQLKHLFTKSCPSCCTFLIHVLLMESNKRPETMSFSDHYHPSNGELGLSLHENYRQRLNKDIFG